MPGSDVFTKLFGEIDVLGVLQLSNGFAFLALLLSAVLISIAIVKGKLDLGTKQLVTRFLYVAAAFVVISTIPTVLAPFAEDGNPQVRLKVGSISTPAISDPFPIHLIYGDDEHDVMSKPYETLLTAAMNHVRINPSQIVAKINAKSAQITELTKQLEMANSPSEEDYNSNNNNIDFGG